MERFIDQEVEAYAKRRTQQEPVLLQTLETETWKTMEWPQMLSGRLSGRFLKLLVQISGAKNVLEVGTFTGYSALCLAEGLPENGRVITCDINEKCAKLAQKYFDQSPHGKKIALKLGPALTTIAQFDGLIDLAFIDGDKVNYQNYYEALVNKVRPGGLIVIDNCLWSGLVLAPTDPSSIAIDSLNELISRDERVENVILTVRDGLNIVRKK
jgi:caffeoyl-CoA O-methyltransferase